MKIVTLYLEHSLSRFANLAKTRWSFFRPPKTTYQRILQNQVQIDFDNANDDFCDENGNNFDDYGDENDQKTDKYHVFLVKIYPL